MEFTISAASSSASCGVASLNTALATASEIAWLISCQEPTIGLGVPFSTAALNTFIGTSFPKKGSGELTSVDSNAGKYPGAAPEVL
ncbi:hypothetical protein D3C80_1541200 [compost metagenome]